MNDSQRAPATAPGFVLTKRRLKFLGLTLDDAIKAFFGGNALVSVVVLTLITIFLVREGAGFFGQNRDNLEIYRRAGLEFVDIPRRQLDDHTALTRYLSDIRVRQFQELAAAGMAPEQINEQFAAFDEFSNRFSDAAAPLRGLVSDLSELVTATKEKFQVGQDRVVERQQLLQSGRAGDASKVQVDAIDFEQELKPVLATLPVYRETAAEFSAALSEVIAETPALPGADAQRRLRRFQELARAYVASFPETLAKMEAWDFRQPVPWWRSFTTFVFGKKWLTASFWQDWYGIVPLFVGSLMVSLVALALAVPFGIGAAIYVNQIATPAEQKLIKPCIEFIAAIPSVVLGFFGIAVLGQALRAVSQLSWLSWVPGFPYSERLNILTAGCLLALIAVPTIFTLAEDALNNVPRAMKEASFALGASRLQTILRIIVPASLSGLISAVLLGLGRVIGETMVVLLCAGNRIAIPDFTEGLAVITQPVHTMTGIIAQEMGEVVQGSIHYRALFVVGLVLFLLSLIINFAAQKVVRRYRISIG